MDQKYSFAVKLIMAGIAVGVAAYFGADVSAYIGTLLGGSVAIPQPQ